MPLVELWFKDNEHPEVGFIAQFNAVVAPNGTIHALIVPEMAPFLKERIDEGLGDLYAQREKREDN